VPSLDPTVFIGDYTGFDRGVLVHDTLLRQLAGGKWGPELATAMTSPDQGLTWNMTLRSGVTFSDGTPVNANAV
jgi:ABC-type transport system substrate-binding protein